LQVHLAERGVSTGIHYPTPLPLLPAYRYLGLEPEDFPVTSAYQTKILSLPIYPEMSEDCVDFVCNEILAFHR
jgi:dTDP-4-amino-4,6-dideoxygalactose transaminase